MAFIVFAVFSFMAFIAFREWLMAFAGLLFTVVAGGRALVVDWGALGCMLILANTALPGSGGAEFGRFVGCFLLVVPL